MSGWRRSVVYTGSLQKWMISRCTGTDFSFSVQQMSLAMIRTMNLIAVHCRLLSKIFKHFKNFKNFKKFQKFQKFQKISKNSKNFKISKNFKKITILPHDLGLLL